MLIDNVKESWKLASVQISLLLIVLESLQAYADCFPEPYASTIRTILITAIPVARLLKQKVKD